MSNEKATKEKMTPERLEAWAKDTDAKFERFAMELAASGAFQKLAEVKDFIKAPVLVLNGTFPYTFHEKALPLIAQMGNLGYFDEKNRGFSNHLYVTRQAVQRGDTEIAHPSKGSHYVDINIRRKAGDTVLDSPQKVIPMWNLSGKFSDKMDMFLVDKDGHRQSIPYDTYGTRVAHLVDYASITKEAMEKEGAKAVLSKAWEAAKEKHKEIIAQAQPEYEKRIKAIKETDTGKRPKKGDEFLFYLKKAYDETMAKENTPKVEFPNSVTFLAAKQAILAGATPEAVKNAVEKFAPGAARDFGAFHHADNVINAIAVDYRFQRQLKEKQQVKEQGVQH